MTLVRCIKFWVNASWR